MYILDIFGRFLAPLPVRGKVRLAESLLRNVNAAEIISHPAKGVTIHLRPEMRIERWMWAGAYETKLVSVLKRFLEPGMTFLDIGANIGFFSTLAAGLVGTTGRVYAFEPNPTCLSRLKLNLKPHPWATIYPVAACDQATTADFYQNHRADEQGWGSLLQSDELATPLKVLVVRLDDWYREHSVGRIDFLKIDVEGAEFQVLTGAVDLLRTLRPVIVIELNATCLARDHHNIKDVLRLLTDADYDMFSLDSEDALGIPQEAARIHSRLSRFLGKPIGF